MAILLPTRKADSDKIMSLVPIRNLVPFPHAEFQVVFGRPKSTAALMSAYEGGKTLMVVAQKDQRIDEPRFEELYEFGVVCKVEHVLQIDGSVHAILRGVQRAKIIERVGEDPFMRVKVTLLSDVMEKSKETKVLADHLYRELKKALNLGKIFDPSVWVRLSGGVDITELVDQVAFSLDVSVAEKEEILETLSLNKRIEKVGERLAQEINVLRLEHSIENKTKAKFESQMKKAVLEERKREIEKELKKLGVENLDDSEMRELRKKVEEAKMPPAIEKKAKRELERLEKMTTFAPEASYIRTYLEWLAEMPWGKRTTDAVNLKKAMRILNDDHFGLKQIKERIIEHLAVMKLRKSKARKNVEQNDFGGSNILCFIGPPGVGKTSIGRSVAKALGRKFVRISLGGIRDEAEIRGHRRTYVGALPGRIIQGIKNAGTKNPVFMLDEIDKVGADFRGDPSAALLEVLDPEQNKEFSDHYLEVPFDLSEVFFILTGNVTQTIPSALIDRLEVIHFSGYTNDEKLNIAKRYLVPKQINKHALNKGNLTFSNPVINQLISRYTREAGVRELERLVAAICRKSARKIAEGKKNDQELNVKSIHKLLGSAKFSNQLKNMEDEIGVSTGLAWTQAGGEILFIEAALLPGKGNFILTGKLGKVMKESCQAALSYVRSHWKELGVKDQNFAKTTDFHIHIPEGAVPKDGPSAGVAITTALVSALIRKPVKKEVGMTGEITLRGKVLEIGGVKEKILAAHRAGIEMIILPSDNRKDLSEIPAKVRKSLKFVFAKNIDQVLTKSLSS